mgnify:CR=1 FL=1
MSRLQEQYKKEILPKLKKELGVSNSMSVPKIEKITINMGLGSALGDKKVLESALEELGLISSQKPVTCLARKSVASFKLREGNAIGCKVTLRKERMYEFLDRLLSIALPRVRDFRGLNTKSFDGQGNYSLGVTEQLVFPEIQYDKIDAIRGMDITITTSATNNEDGFRLLKEFKFPFNLPQAKK